MVDFKKKEVYPLIIFDVIRNMYDNIVISIKTIESASSEFSIS